MTRPSSEAPLNLPPPQTFDILPSLHELLSRIDHTSPSDLPPHSNSNPDTDPLPPRYADLPPLLPQDLPNEILQFKQKIRAAIKALKDLPDMERGVGEQEEEIRELEDRLREQEALRTRMGGMCGELEERVERGRREGMGREK